MPSKAWIYAGLRKHNGVRFSHPLLTSALDALAIDEPQEYARLALDGELQMWVDAEDSLEIW